tara:strand:+ start:848 stop:1882 length:1035 start_codon:yes stop_codon:yes gene_type:complete
MAKKKKQMKKQRRTKQQRTYNSTPITPENQINLKTMQQELNGALALIQQHSFKSNSSGSDIVGVKDSLANNQSLLERCKAVIQQDTSNKKPTLRIIHHFACSGGTLISKCLAAQPNVFLLSEMHPTTRLGFNEEYALYTPRDITTQAFYGRLPKVDKLAEKIFIAGIKETEQHVRELGGHLVIRAHTHADYCMEDTPPNQDTLTRLLSSIFDIKQLVTVRNPIDSFLSLQENGWIHFKPATFDEYCRRLLLFIKTFGNNSIIKYEDFVSSPEHELKTIEEIFDISSHKNSFDVLDIFKISGDSGRSGIDIFPRPRKPLPEKLKKEIEESKNFKTVQQLLNYQRL